MNKMILIGVTGGIAAFKTIELVSSLTQKGYDVRVIMTQSAIAMIPIEAFEKASGHAVYTTLFDTSFDYKSILDKRRVDHIELANSASLFVIVPATANVVAKLAAGIADDYVTTTALATTCPIMIAPSMNVFMWKNPITQKNIQTLRRVGMHIMGPDRGMLACGYEGEGRLMDVHVLEGEIIQMVHKHDELKGKKIIITAGGTTEPIDDVRVITNKSSGKMGVALAEQCFLRGANVLLLRSQTSVIPRYAIPEMVFDSSDSLQQLLQKEAPTADMCIHVAAVSDFQVKKPKKGKISSNTSLPLELEPRTKILDIIKSYNPNIVLVAFKAEWGVSDETLVELASSRRAHAKADFIVANDVGRAHQGFQSDDNEVFVIDSKGTSTHLQKANKAIIANGIMDIIAPSLV
jgi:phosphopantothenoylcysteine decarboxylase / phosphopantothenate---cysteine ligase